MSSGGPTMKQVVNATLNEGTLEALQNFVDTGWKDLTTAICG
ncbi:ALF repeat-containing protein [Actinopolyspora mortivallis]|uniref:Uncharacterized protein n=1 Tax=Actinopolyspora mortivallis TaxID=33906 RepID=A0A2T0GXG8_ACTMO|nr:hypothetical protein CEP50_08470 [Actinopolyspora mortivallis]